MQLQYPNEDLLASSHDTAGVASPNNADGVASPEHPFSNHHDATEPSGHEPTAETQDEDPSSDESSPEESPGPGRPSHLPTPANRQRVFEGARWGELQTEIAKLLNIDPKTLRKHYTEELKRGAIEANNTVMQSLFHMATKREKVGAAIFWAKTRCALRPGGTPYDTAPGAPDPQSEPASKASKRSTSEPEAPSKPDRMRFHVFCNDGEPNAPY